MRYLYWFILIALLLMIGYQDYNIRRQFVILQKQATISLEQEKTINALRIAIADLELDVTRCEQARSTAVKKLVRLNDR